MTIRITPISHKPRRWRNTRNFPWCSTGGGSTASTLGITVDLVSGLMFFVFIYQNKNEILTYKGIFSYSGNCYTSLEINYMIHTLRANNNETNIRLYFCFMLANMNQPKYIINLSKRISHLKFKPLNWISTMTAFTFMQIDTSNSKSA